MWVLIEQEKALMCSRNTIVVYLNDLNKYMMVEESISENAFDYHYDVGAKQKRKQISS